MRSTWSLGIILAAGVALWAFQTETEKGSARANWEYAIVESWSSSSGSLIAEGDHFLRDYHGRAVICYLQESGCKSQQIEITTPPYTELRNKENANHFDDAQQDAVAKAVALLGSAGWELLGSGPALVWMSDLNRPSAPISPALYFKRIKR